MIEELSRDELVCLGLGQISKTVYATRGRMAPAKPLSVVKFKPYQGIKPQQYKSVAMEKDRRTADIPVRTPPITKADSKVTKIDSNFVSSAKAPVMVQLKDEWDREKARESRVESRQVVERREKRPISDQKMYEAFTTKEVPLLPAAIISDTPLTVPYIPKETYETIQKTVEEDISKAIQEKRKNAEDKDRGYLKTLITIGVIVGVLNFLRR